MGAQRPDVEAGQLRILLTREDQGKRHGSVEQIGAAPLTGLGLGAAHVQHVIEHLEGEADVHPICRQRLDLVLRAIRGEAAETAGDGEEASGLELAAP